MTTTDPFGIRWIVANEQLTHSLCIDTSMELLPEVVVAEALRYVSQ
jgi:hypothetical protein